MVGAHLYFEGGGNGKDLQARAREGLTKLLIRAGFEGRLPRVTACGKRDDALDDFRTTMARGVHDFVALLVDSEEPVEDIDRPWAHLRTRDGWERPSGAGDEQVFLMTTSMETWIASDRVTLMARFGDCFRVSALPTINGIENRTRSSVRKALESATRDCGKDRTYAKGRWSFELLGLVESATLREALPSFARMLRILDERLPIGQAHAP